MIKLLKTEFAFNPLWQSPNHQYFYKDPNKNDCVISTMYHIVLNFLGHESLSSQGNIQKLLFNKLI